MCWTNPIPGQFSLHLPSFRDNVQVRRQPQLGFDDFNQSCGMQLALPATNGAFSPGGLTGVPPRPGTRHASSLARGIPLFRCVRPWGR